MRPLLRLNKHFARYIHLLLLGVLFVSVSNSLKVYSPILVQETIDYIVSFTQDHTTNNVLNLNRIEKDSFFNYILELSAYILIIALSSGFFLFLTRQTIIVMSRKIEFDMKNEIYEHYQSLPLSFYRKNNTGDLMNRISDDVSKVRMYVGPAVMYGLNMIVIFAIVIPVMVSVNAELTFYCLLPLPFLSIGIYFISDKINKQSEKIQSSLSDLSTFVQEAFSGIRIIKTFVREKDSVQKFTQQSEEYKNKSLKLALINALFFPIIFGLIGLSTIATIYIGGILVIDQEVSYGNLAQFFLYLNMITWPVTSVGWVTSIIQQAAASQIRINEFLDTKSTIKSTGNDTTEIKGGIKFKDVSLTYPDSGVRAIKNLSFEIKPGETLAIVGGTGSGKSSIANLISRNYDPEQGVIEIDGTTISDYNINHLRSKMGYVPQDTFLFSDTILNNIAFGSDSTDIDKIETAAKNAHVHHNIIDFPDGYQTILGERGVTLSGGQKQRVTLARALIRNPKILILDDSLSAIDTKTEDFILGRLTELMREKTAIIISHRVSSVKLADRIIFLENGILLEQGSHKELIIKNGAYKKLYDSQLEESK